MLKFRELEGFLSFLLDLELIGRDSYKRTKIGKKLDDLFNERYQEILLEYAEKNHKGDPVINVNADGSNTYSIINKDEYNNEIKAFMEREVDLFLSEEESSFLKRIFLETDKKFKNEEALIYHRWCEFVESL